jgi:hypothetical protein
VSAVRPLITLLTDFGDRDWFVASMKGVILGINPDTHIVDISHQITPHRIEEAAYVLESCYQYFPRGTVHVAVVDPGVGSTRRPLLASSSRCYFLAPDNGLLSRVLRKERDVAIRQVDNPAYRLEAEGATFDGRDVFAPAAGWLTRGEPVSSFGPIIGDPVMLVISEPTWEGKTLAGTVDYIDRFGNLILNITASHIREFQERTGRQAPAICVGPYTIDGLVASYRAGNRESPAALVNSCGKLEIFFYSDSAAQRLQIGLGETIRLRASG